MTANQSNEAQLVSQVQHAINQLRDDVQVNMVRLRDEMEAALRVEREGRTTNEQLTLSLADAVQQVSTRVGQAPSDVAARLESVEQNESRHRRQTDERMNRLIDDTNGSIRSMVEGSVRDVERSITHRQDTNERALEALHQRLNDFDLQASRMVEYFTETTESFGRRLDDQALSASPSSSEPSTSAVEARLDALSARLDEQLDETQHRVGAQIDDLERRLGEQLTAAVRMSEERTGEQLASMDAFLGQTGGGLDDAITMLNDRITALDERLSHIANG
ncbi:MAG: hypothetical protein AB8G14_10600 [Ilumatobacter sp.]